MRVQVVGAGAIGAWLIAGLARGGAEVSLVARGATLAAIRAEGLRLITGERTERFHLPVAEDAAGLPPPDLVLYVVKSHQLADAVAATRAALVARPAPVIATAMNGLSWWFLDGLDVPAGPLVSIDPDGRIGAQCAGHPIIGGVVHGTTTVLAPGVVRVNRMERLVLGEPGGGLGASTRALAAHLECGGISAPLTDDIRAEIWLKLWGNMSMNPVSALTRLTAGPLLSAPASRDVMVAMMEEFSSLGARLGFTPPMPAADRLAMATRLGDFKTSMLSDVEAGRPLEVEALLGAVVEIADRVGLAMQVSRTVLALARGLDLALRRVAKS
jgi:2-dehydropantoate 2-reductase